MPKEGHTVAAEPHTNSTQNIRIQHENEPSQGLPTFVWHAKDFGTAHEVAAEV